VRPDADNFYAPVVVNFTHYRDNLGRSNVETYDQVLVTAL
jgi:hypothetical protein